jgi:nickel-dependent lactate racemase
MMECASLVKPDFIVNGVSNLDGDICDILAGNWVSAWLRATQLVDAMHGVEIQEKADIVIASAEGYPTRTSTSIRPPRPWTPPHTPPGPAACR